MAMQVVLSCTGSRNAKELWEDYYSTVSVTEQTGNDTQAEAMQTKGSRECRRYRSCSDIYVSKKDE